MKEIVKRTALEKNYVRYFRAVFLTCSFLFLVLFPPGETTEQWQTLTKKSVCKRFTVKTLVDTALSPFSLCEVTVVVIGGKW
jgi:hypothetical protein